jgi:hypothetical protein
MIDNIVEKYLNEAVKSKLTKGVYGKIRIIENWKGHKKLYVHKQGNNGYCVTTDPSISLDNMVEIDGQFWFGTLKDLHDSLNA